MKAACHSSRKFPLAIMATFTIVLGNKYSTLYINESIMELKADNQLEFKLHNIKISYRIKCSPTIKSYVDCCRIVPHTNTLWETNNFYSHFE